jgi:putative tricarboxylic transport membrane protein
MTLHHVDRWLGPVLVLLAVGWSWTVLQTIPADEIPGEAGARDFPLLLGVALGVLGLIMTLSAFFGRAETGAREERIAPVSRQEANSVGFTVLLLVAYAFLLDKIGFLVATPIVVVAALRLIAGERSWPKILLVAAGLTIGSYLLFGVLMHANLPRGTWLQSL